MDVDIPRVAGSLDELVAGATERVPLRPADARSGATFERLRIDGRRYFLKVLSAEADWIMRVTGNTTHWELAGLAGRAVRRRTGRDRPRDGRRWRWTGPARRRGWRC